MAVSRRAGRTLRPGTRTVADRDPQEIGDTAQPHHRRHGHRRIDHREGQVPADCFAPAGDHRCDTGSVDEGDRRHVQRQADSRPSVQHRNSDPAQRGRCREVHVTRDDQADAACTHAQANPELFRHGRTAGRSRYSRRDRHRVWRPRQLLQDGNVIADQASRHTGPHGTSRHGYSQYGPGGCHGNQGGGAITTSDGGPKLARVCPKRGPAATLRALDAPHPILSRLVTKKQLVEYGGRVTPSDPSCRGHRPVRSVRSATTSAGSTPWGRPWRPTSAAHCNASVSAAARPPTVAR